MKNKKGFTIVELVIVIAVIAILAAVLIPTFTTVTANARASAALSTAKNAQTAVLGNSEGSMPELTLVAVSNDKDAYAEYAFIVNERKLESVKLNSINMNETASPAKVYPAYAKSTRTEAETTITTYTYTVFVTADYFDGDKNAKVKDAVEGLVKDVLDRQINNRTEEKDDKTGTWKTVKSTVDDGKEYATWEYTPKTADATKEYVLNVYYNADIPETAVVFFANN